MDIDPNIVVEPHEKEVIEKYGFHVRGDGNDYVVIDPVLVKAGGGRRTKSGPGRYRGTWLKMLLADAVQARQEAADAVEGEPAPNAKPETKHARKAKTEALATMVPEPSPEPAAEPVPEPTAEVVVPEPAAEPAPEPESAAEMQPEQTEGQPEPSVMEGILDTSATPDSENQPEPAPEPSSNVVMLRSRPRLDTKNTGDTVSGKKDFPRVYEIRGATLDHTGERAPKAKKARAPRAERESRYTKVARVLIADPDIKIDDLIKRTGVQESTCNYCIEAFRDIRKAFEEAGLLKEREKVH